MSDGGGAAAEARRERIRQRLAAVWEGHKGHIAEQIEIVERAARDLLGGELDEAARDDAVREAHKLAGTVGTFGFSRAAALARDLELGFEAGTENLSREQAARMVELATSLRFELAAASHRSPWGPDHSLRTPGGAPEG